MLVRLRTLNYSRRVAHNRRFLRGDKNNFLYDVAHRRVIDLPHPSRARPNGAFRSVAEDVVGTQVVSTETGDIGKKVYVEIQLGAGWIGVQDDEEIDDGAGGGVALLV